MNSGYFTYLTFILIVALLFTTSLAVEFDYRLKPKEMECFGEMLTADTIITTEVFAHSNEIVARLYDPEGHILETRQNEYNPRISHHAESSGHYSLCIDNMGQEDVTLTIRIHAGVEAKDYSQLANSNNLRPIELELMKLGDIANEIKKDTKQILQSDEAKLHERDKIPSRMTMFSVITVIVLIVLAAIQLFYLKSFFKSKKLL